MKLKCNTSGFPLRRTRLRGYLVLEIVVALGIGFAVFGSIIMLRGSIARQERFFRERAMAAAVLHNVIERAVREKDFSASRLAAVCEDELGFSSLRAAVETSENSGRTSIRLKSLKDGRIYSEVAL